MEHAKSAREGRGKRGLIYAGADRSLPTAGSPALFQRLTDVAELAAFVGEHLVTDDLAETTTDLGATALANRDIQRLAVAPVGLVELRQEVREINKMICDAIIPGGGVPHPSGLNDLRRQPRPAQYVVAIRDLYPLFPTTYGEVLKSVARLPPSSGAVEAIKAAFDNIEIKEPKLRHSLIDATIKALPQARLSALQLLYGQKADLNREDITNIEKLLKDNPQLFAYKESFDLVSAGELFNATKRMAAIEDENVKARVVLAASQKSHLMTDASKRNVIDSGLSILRAGNRDKYAESIFGIGMWGQIRAESDAMNALVPLVRYGTDEQRQKLSQVLKTRPELYVFEAAWKLTTDVARASKDISSLENRYNMGLAAMGAFPYKSLMDKEAQENVIRAALTALSDSESRSPAPRLMEKLRTFAFEEQRSTPGLVSGTIAAPFAPAASSASELRAERSMPGLYDIQAIETTPEPIIPINTRDPRPKISEIRIQLDHAITTTLPQTQPRLDAVQEISRRFLRVSPRDELDRIRSELRTARLNRARQDGYGL